MGSWFDFDLDEALDWARNKEPVYAALLFFTVNLLSTSIIPIPMGVWLMVIAGILYGQVLGLAFYLGTCLLGAWITFVLVRLVRHRAIAMLGEHAEKWRRLDAAITREGLWICLLWRIAPIAPYVVSSTMISMTDIKPLDYLWTTALGIIPSSFPIVSAAALADKLVLEQKEVDPLTLGINVLSLVAGVYVMVRLAVIAADVLKKIDSGAADDEPATDGSSGSSSSPAARSSPRTNPVGRLARTISEGALDTARNTARATQATARAVGQAGDNTVRAIGQAGDKVQAGVQGMLRGLLGGASGGTSSASQELV